MVKFIPFPNCFFSSYVPLPNNEKTAEIRSKWATTQLLLFQPGLTPATLPDDLEAAMSVFVDTEYCPKIVRDDYLASMRQI